MPLDANIILKGFNPPPLEDPLENAAKAYTLKSHILQAQNQERQFRMQDEFQKRMAGLPADAPLDTRINAAIPYLGPKEIIQHAGNLAVKQEGQKQRLFEIQMRGQQRAEEIAQAERERRITREEADARTAELQRWLQTQTAQARMDAIQFAASLRPPRETPKPEAVIDPDTGKAILVTREEAIRRRLSPALPGQGGDAATQLPPPPPAGPLSFDPTVATGPSGFAAKVANTITEGFGMGLAYPRAQQASKALTELNVRTVTMLQDAIPGRPSNYLMQKLDQLAVEPGKWFSGDQSAKLQLEQTRSMLANEVQRMRSQVLANPQAYSKNDVSKTRNNLGQLELLLRDYDSVISSIKGGGSKGSLRKITNESDYNAIPKGEKYIAPDGSIRMKQ